MGEREREQKEQKEQKRIWENEKNMIGYLERWVKMINFFCAAPQGSWGGSDHIRGGVWHERFSGVGRGCDECGNGSFLEWKNTIKGFYSERNVERKARVKIHKTESFFSFVQTGTKANRVVFIEEYVGKNSVKSKNEPMWEIDWPLKPCGCQEHESSKYFQPCIGAVK
jgi:hypothetical protein